MNSHQSRTIIRRNRTSAIDKSFRALVVLGIKFYQRYLSPIKGYRCAHGLLHGGQTCSAYVKTAFMTNSFGNAVQISRQRFRQCNQAYLILNRDGLIGDSSLRPLKAASCDICCAGCSIF
jgi:putative component of membrane protein insertase Oxa1/YidC/SpoIIIJ protein YidD